MSLSLRRGAALAAGVVSLAVPAAASGAPALPAQFVQGVWNRVLPANAPLAANSASEVGAIANSVATNGAVFNVRAYAPRVYTVPTNQANVPIVIDGSASYQQLLNTAMNINGGVPIPVGALPSSLPGGKDKDSTLVVYQPGWNDGTGRGTGRVWEFWHVSNPTQNAPGAGALPWGKPSHGDSKWHAEWGGRLSYVSTSPGYAVNRNFSGGTLTQQLQRAQTDPSFEGSGWLATETSLAMLGGEITLADWQKGSIDHAIGLGLPDAIRSGTSHVWPAQRHDQQGQGAIPEGTHLRLPANYPVDPTLPKIVQLMITAAKKYGFIVWGRGASVGVRFELTQTGDPWSCPTAPCTNDWLMPGGAFYATKLAQVPKQFPWSALQVVTKPGSPTDLAPPTLAQPANLTVKTGQTISIPLTATSPGNYPLTYALDTTPQLGTATPTPTGLDYTATTPGTDTITVHANDGTLNSPTQTFTITVT